MPEGSTRPHPTYTTPHYHNPRQIASHCTHCPFRRLFDLNKYNWSQLSNERYQGIGNSPAHPNHYNGLVDLVKKATRHNIPRGCQKEYIPGLSNESSDLLKKLYDEEYHKVPFAECTIKPGDTLLDKIFDERRKILRDIMENTNLTMNRKKAWAIWGIPCLRRVVTNVTADQIANLLLPQLFPLLCGVHVYYETPPSRPVLRVLL